MKEAIIEKDYTKKLLVLFKHPSAFFKSVEKDSDYKKIMFFYVVIATVSILAAFLPTITQIIFKPETLALTKTLTFINIIFSAIFGIIFAFIAPFIGAAVVHLGVLIFRGKQGFFNTYKPITYSSAISQIYKIILAIVGIPLIFIMPGVNFNTLTQNQFLQLLTTNNATLWGLGIIFLISLISFIHSLTAGVIGLAKFQKMGKWRAFFSMILLPLIILIIAGIVFAYLLASVSPA